MRRLACVAILAACGGGGGSSKPAEGSAGGSNAAKPPAKVVEPPPAPKKPVTERRLFPSKLDASSVRPADTEKFRYDAAFAFDGNPKTAWNEGAPGPGSGEWLRFAVTKQEGVRKVRLKIRNGFQYSDAIYKANARAKAVEVKLLPAGQPKKLTLEDKQGTQELVVTAEGVPLEAIELRVVDVFGGAQYEDLAISEIEIYVTSESKESPDVEKKNLEALLAPLEVEPMAADADVIIEDSDARKPPADVAPFLERAHSSLGAKLGVSDHRLWRGGYVDLNAIEACAERSLPRECVDPLFVVTGASLKPVDKPAPDVPQYVGPGEDPAPCANTVRTSDDGQIHELVFAGCHSMPGRSGMMVTWTYAALEYDDAGRVRAFTDGDKDIWVEWVESEGSWTAKKHLVK